MSDVAILFAMPGSVYNSIPGCDVYDLARDAKTFPGGFPVVAHPPCRTWGNLAKFATLAVPGERDLAIWAVQQVRENGGVLEHPATSKLWPELSLPGVGAGFDSFGGFSIGVLQFWFGHRAEKRTKLYICGLDLRDVPELPFKMGYPTHIISGKTDNAYRKKHVNKRERSATPEPFALWLVKLAKLTGKANAAV